MDDNNSQGEITKQLLKTRSGEFDLESIHSLVLRQMGISQLGCLGECSGLERLDLTGNDISKLYTLASLTNIVYINLSANRIVSLEGLQALDNLKRLNVAGNIISSLDTLHTLSGLEKFEDLRMQDEVHGLSNPVCTSTGYKECTINILPRLQVLDGERVSGRGSEVYKMSCELELMIKARHSHIHTVEVPTPGPWVQDGYWESHQVAAFERSSLGDAEQQLQDLLTECERVSKEADGKLQRALQEVKAGSSAS